MKLAEALAVLKAAPVDASPFPVLLACGFTPLHLRSYLAAHLQQRLPQQRVDISVGLYDDLLGTVASLAEGSIGRAALIIEWADLDPRLGFRSLGGWGQKAVPGILESVRSRLTRLKSEIDRLSASFRLAVTTPTLPLPPGFHTISSQSSEAELILHSLISEFARDIASHPAVSVLNQQELAYRSPASSRHDLRTDLNAGFPYTLSHTEALADQLARLISPIPAKKGLITDLDDTLWLGLVGEIGSDAVSWDLAGHAQQHGLYQQMLQALADQGVLVAIASKNTESIARPAFERSDCALSPASVFPLEIHWDPKSVSVGRILKAWNIGADSVVFVDDNPLELDEVKSAHPDVECLLFPKNDYAAFLPFLQGLRDRFGKPRLSEEDSYRLASIRQSQQLMEEGEAQSPDSLLASLDAEIAIEVNPPLSDSRVLELVNKTNQFNLNGRRIADDTWAEQRKDPSRFVFAVSYKDKYGPLGKIAVAVGRKDDKQVILESWVMSCRAFSRRIEHQTLAQLFAHFDAETISFDFEPTSKNAPTESFLRTLTGDALRISRNDFSAGAPELHHKVTLKHG